MKKRFYLGIDVGSSGVKVMIVDEDGEPCGIADSEYETRYPRPGFVEQDAEDWYPAACTAARRAISNSNMVDCRFGVRFSGTTFEAAIKLRD